MYGGRSFSICQNHCELACIFSYGFILQLRKTRAKAVLQLIAASIERLLSSSAHEGER